MSDGLDLIERIEFHESKSRDFVNPTVETRFYVKDLEAFLAYCDGGDWEKQYDKSQFDYNMKRVAKSKAQRPKFDMTILRGNIIDIYPREKMVAVKINGIHYICQHAFDIIPEGDRNVFYPFEGKEDFIVGELTTLWGEKFPVRGSDIHIGFMQSAEVNDTYGDSFGMFIRAKKEHHDERAKKSL
jgi:hypothetical protein